MRKVSLFLQDFSSTNSVAKDQQLTPVKCEVRLIQKEQLESEKTHLRNAKITISKENAVSNNKSTPNISRESLKFKKTVRSVT